MGKQKINKQIFPSKEIFQRINFLYQGTRTAMVQCPDNLGISNYYSNLMTNIARKGIIRLEPDVKRTLCKGCNNFMLPGVTARVRLNKKSKQWLVWTCLICHTVKRFYTQRGHKLWCETPEAIVNVLKFDNTSPSDSHSCDNAEQSETGKVVNSNGMICTTTELSASDQVNCSASKHVEVIE